MLRIFAALLLAASISAVALAQSTRSGTATDAPAIDFNFVTDVYQQQSQSCVGFIGCITTVRALNASILLPTSPAGTSPTTYGVNSPRIVTGSGLLIEEARTNLLLNSNAPATQTTGALAAVAHTLWMNGNGSIALSNGTATGCAGTATNGSPVTFTPTAGTCTVTVTGSVAVFQLEAGAFGTSWIQTAGATVLRPADVITVTNVPTFQNSRSYFAKFTPLGGVSVLQGIVEGSDGTGNNSDMIYLSGTATIANLTNKSGGVVGANLNRTPTAVGSSAKVAAAMGPSSQAIVLNGGTASTTTSTVLAAGSSINRIDLGDNEAGNRQLDGWLERVVIWPTSRLPNAQLQNITGTNWAMNNNIPSVAADYNNDILKRQIRANAR